MCDFISWMRNGLELYYLTEKELNSPKGDLLLSRKDNDPLGHGAIRKYFGLEGITTAKEFENRDFWNGNLPEPIKDAWNKGDLD